ncbi:hypothetical protein [Paraburkholderia oxyphila]|uniref:hypothetical protein n=1 Tax=Paraburkholderia oxyphila TaxID=614212 RepID=UPI0014288B1F|nr:hypothetical protein [Paraburkholderia oxyphila]
MPSTGFPALWRETVDSVSNAMKVTRRATTVCVALWVCVLAQAQEVGTAGTALSGAFFYSASLAAKAAHNVLDSARIDNIAVPQLDSAGRAPPTRVMPFFDGGYGHRRPAIGLNFSFDLGEANSSPPVSLHT